LPPICRIFNSVQTQQMSDDLADYDYVLPDELIARHPLERRDESRLMVIDRRQGTIEHAIVRDLPQFLKAGDCLVLNDTQVLPARLRGHRVATGGQWEGLFLEATAEGHWRLMGQTRGKLQPGEQISLRPFRPEASGEYRLTLLHKDDEGLWTARPADSRQPVDVLREFGTVPLPPYMERERPDTIDFERYQTVYARVSGSVAAPTAGLHFTPELLAACEARGVSRTMVTLHVGLGTFRPIAVERLSEHRMHSEWCEVSAATAATLNRTRETGGRIVAVGTTSVRTLESASSEERVHPWSGPTRLFIRPPYQFQVVDVLLTNFHLPKSTLLVLVSTLAGRDLIRAAYAAAIAKRYRFFSYGDAMLIV
jgi:S-adenosylmethionine:tRNA ribosyltransferase-isomerase